MNKQNYKKYLDSDHWLDVRVDVIRRYKKCVACGSDFRLNVHHRSYKNLGHEKNKDLRLLCNKCHGNIHKAVEIRNQRHPKAQSLHDATRRYIRRFHRAVKRGQDSFVLEGIRFPTVT